MSVSSAYLLAESTGEGSQDNEGKREYRLYYRVVTTSANDGARVIVDYFRDTGGLPKLGVTGYGFGNDVDASAICTRIAPRRERSSPVHWLVEVTFSSPPQEKTDPDGNPSSNPLEWADKLRRTVQNIDIPVRKATYIKGFKGAMAAFHAEGDELTPYNSAFTLYSEPLMRPLGITVYQVTKYLAEYPDWSEYSNRVNSDLCSIGSLTRNLFVLCDKYSLLFREGQAASLLYSAYDEDSDTWSNQWYWEVSYELWHHPDAWTVDILDQGTHARYALPGDTDGAGGSISAMDLPLEAGAPRSRPLIGPLGHAITEPVPFNGNGSPLSPGDDLVYITWLPYERRAFSAAPFLNIV